MIQQALDALELGAPTTRGHLTMIPLLESRGAEPFYATLDEALETGAFRVTEVSEGGSVPDLLATNQLDRPVLIVHGEQLVGAKQNRIVNLTILVPPSSSLKIPVSCVEQGRWDYRSPEFKSSDHPLNYASRARAAAEVSERLARREAPRADQLRVWEMVDRRLRELGVRSETGAVEDAYEARRAQIDATADMAPAPNQVGAVFLIRGHVAGLELFDAPRTLAGMLRKIANSYALDALDARSAAPPTRSPEEAARALLDRVREAKVATIPSVGLGVAVRITGRGTAGGGLALNDALVHLAAFRLPAETSAPTFRPPHSRGSFGGNR